MEGEFPTWKTIKLGTYKSVQELSKALTDGRFLVDDWASSILEKTTLAGVETEIELVCVSGYNLGFITPARRDAIYNRALEFDLVPVPAEVGPQLRLAYTDQPTNDGLLVAMEPLAGPTDIPIVFVVMRHDLAICLYTEDGRPDSEWDPYYWWVFTRR
jgi:hypothetical protein